MRFQKEDETVTFYKGPPQGPIGATLGTAINNFYSSPNMVSTHYITWPFSFWIWRRRCLKFAWFWPFGALPLGPHGGHTYYLNNFESPTPKDDFCQVLLKSNHAFSRRRWKCKKFTDDGRKRTAIAHLSLRLRWAKNAQSPHFSFQWQEYSHVQLKRSILKSVTSTIFAYSMFLNNVNNGKLHYINNLW